MKVRGLRTNIQSLWARGFGHVSAQNIANLSKSSDGKGIYQGGLLPHVLLANLPQGLLSCLYLIYDGLFTSMLMEQEWQSFGYR